jgi:hypothetical protein
MLLYIWKFSGNLVYFTTVLVYCITKNLATLGGGTLVRAEP